MSGNLSDKLKEKLSFFNEIDKTVNSEAKLKPFYNLSPNKNNKFSTSYSRVYYLLSKITRTRITKAQWPNPTL